LLNVTQLEEYANQILMAVEGEKEKITDMETGDIPETLKNIGTVELAKYIDHTILKAQTTKDQIEKLCSEAKQYEFASVCVNSSYIDYARQLLKSTPIKVCTVIGFPLGMCLTEVKSYEAKRAVELGAEEVDMVINIGRLKDRDYQYVANDIKAVVDETGGNAIVKVIIETGALTDFEKVMACLLAKEAKAQFVKTSTGFGPGAATVRDVYLMKKAIGGNMRVKASSGIRTREAALRLIFAGAERLGTSAGIAIISG